MGTSRSFEPARVPTTEPRLVSLTDLSEEILSDLNPTSENGRSESKYQMFRTL